MTERKHIPEDIIVDILSRLPVKSLIRFRRVSKRWRSIISDPHFAKLHYFHNKTQSRRSLVYFLNDSDIESLHLDTPSPFSSVRKLTSPFDHGDRLRRRPNIVGSCNGLVCVSSTTAIYIWNPSTGFSLKLPHPGFPDQLFYSNYCGFGYLPDTDDYKVLLAAHNWRETLQMRIFSTRAGIWKRIESPFKSSYPDYITSEAALLGVTLHWRIDFLQTTVIHAFDLVKEECREMPVPSDRLYLDCFGGCLYGFHKHSGCIELWVMREYWVSESWTKLFRLEFSNQGEPRMMLFPFLATQTSTVVAKMIPDERILEIVSIQHEEDEPPLITDRLRRRYHMPSMTVYDESLLHIPDYHAVMIEYKVRKTTDGPAKMKSRKIIATFCLALFNYFWLNILILTLAYSFNRLFQQKQ